MATTLFSISFVVANELLPPSFHVQDDVLNLLPESFDGESATHDELSAPEEPARPIRQMLVGSRRGFIPGQIERLAQGFGIEGVEFLCMSWTSGNLEDSGHVQVLHGDAARRGLSSIERLLDSVRLNPQMAAEALGYVDADIRPIIESNLISSKPTMDPEIGIPDHDGESWECMFAVLRTARHLLDQAVRDDMAFVHLDLQ